ncbi:uroporphyrinogen-III synthase [Sinorhizobium numidicum]|uniref:Uroporphyrinogen-III synthase n=1 Tax=Sinorhizobium numidicum TaxID=680248 RepID=A0ABY8D2G4_9HYPH|nr:uroporphyrinogen-III synthase [Sinorhizobium numidicum]WEX77229.1 uroporphyrinogen-III synthase [Sinorhizobium numidicum]WEX83888.1 uroporphyrinogen-III synthase [Sinorhizobium numidicum]
MRVLVTRPRPAAERTAPKLEAMGHQAVVLPLMQAHHFVAALRTALDRPHEAIALTSAETVRVLAALGPALGPHVATPLFCVGKATARAAADLGFSDVRIGPGTGERLAETIAALIHPGDSKTLLYLTGSPRSDGLERALRDREIDHITVECYRMMPVTYAPEVLSDLTRSGAFDAVLLYSRETARRLTALLQESSIDPVAFSARYLCLSASVKEVLPGGVAAKIAATPNEESLFDLL